MLNKKLWEGRWTNYDVYLIKEFKTQTFCYKCMCYNMTMALQLYVYIYKEYLSTVDLRQDPGNFKLLV